MRNRILAGALSVSVVSAVVAWRAAAKQGPLLGEPRSRVDYARSRTPAEGGLPNINISTNLVLIPVTAFDLRDRLVVGLTRDRFKVYDNGVEQSITHFAQEDAPVSVCIVFDASASMGPKIAKAREAVAEILKTANEADEFALIRFNQRVDRMVDLTDRADVIQNSLYFVQPRGQTALLDALYLAADTMRRARHPRKAVIVISDGGDNSSRYSPRETREMVREANVQIFAVGILESPEKRARTPEEAEGPQLLQSIAEETGGRMFPVVSAEALGAVAAQIGRTLRAQYVLGYSPSDMTADGKYHRVQVKLDQIVGVRLFWRLGYYAPLR